MSRRMLFVGMAILVWTLAPAGAASAQDLKVAANDAFAAPSVLLTAPASVTTGASPAVAAVATPVMPVETASPSVVVKSLEASAPSTVSLRSEATVDVAAAVRRAAERPQIALASYDGHTNPAVRGVLWSLYGMTAVTQALDVTSTFAALKNGQAEADPIFKNLVSNRKAFIAAKAGITAVTILAARSMAKHNKIAAIAALVGINSAYAYIVQRNYQMARMVN